MRRGWHLAAGFAYLLGALWAMRPVLPVIADTYPIWGALTKNAVGDGDQSHMVWATSRNARTILTAPRRAWDFEICHPFPRAVALGHHLYANGLVAIVPYALTGEPVLALNVVSIVMLWASAMAMYALACYWTGSPAAAFIAGLLFAFAPQRITWARWPSIVGNQWTPLALLCTDRLFRRGRWRDATAVAAFTSLQILESFYQMLPLAVLGGTYAGVLARSCRDQLRALAPKLLTVGAVMAAVTAFVAVPYLDVRATWHTLSGRESPLPLLNQFLPGNERYPGTVLLVLAVLGIADRLRGRRGDDDPRLPLLAGGLLVLSLMVRGVVLPGLGVMPSPGAAAAALVPGFESVRALQFGIAGVWLALGVLAAYGMLALVERSRPAVAAGITVGVAALALGEVFHPAIATRSFRVSLALEARPLSASREVARLVRERFDDGAVLDVPARQPPLAFSRRAHYVLSAAFHRRPTIGCFTSFDSPLREAVEALAARLPDQRAAAALHALGFRGIVVHEEELTGPGELAAVVDALARAQTGDPRLVPAGAADGHRLYRLESAVPVRDDLALLAAGASAAIQPPAQWLVPSAGAVDVTFRNLGPATFRHPDPIAPTRLLRAGSAPTARRSMSSASKPSSLSHSPQATRSPRPSR